MTNTRSTKAKATVPTPEAETPLSAIIRLASEPTSENVASMHALVTVADDALRLATFHGRVTTSAMVGYTIVAEATVKLGMVPDGAAKAIEACGVTHKSSAEYLGRRYSTLEECYRIASHHTAERLESFVAAYSEAHGRNPESVRAYSVWVGADAKGGARAAKNTVETLKARATAAAKAKASAETAAKAKATERVTLAKAKAVAKPTELVIVGCPLTKAEWEAMDEATLAKVELLAGTMRAAKAKARRSAETAAKDSSAAGETGPKAKAKPRTKVTA